MTERLLRDRSFRLLWTSQAASVAGLAVRDVAIPVLLYQLTGSALLTAVSVGLSVAPYTVLGLLAGAVADRVDRRRLLVGCDAASAALLASVPVAAAFDTLTVPHLYAVTLATSSLWVWSDAAFFGAVPAVVGRAHIVEANGRLYSTRMALGVIAPGVAGLAIARFGAGFALVLPVVCAVVSLLAILLVRRSLQVARGDVEVATATAARPEPLADVDPAIAAPAAAPTLRDDIVEGLRFVWAHPLVRPLTLLGLGNSLSGGAVFGLLVVYGTRALGLAPDDARIGTLFTAGAAGALLATLALPRLTRRLGVERVTLYGLTAHVLLLLALVPIARFEVALVALFAWQASYILVIVNGISLRQLVTPDHLQSRVNTTARLIATAGAPLGALLGGVLAEVAGIRWAIAAAAVGVAISAAIGWRSPLRRAAVGHAGDGSAPVAHHAS